MHAQVTIFIALLVHHFFGKRTLNVLAPNISDNTPYITPMDSPFRMKTVTLYGFRGTALYGNFILTATVDYIFAYTCIHKSIDNVDIQRFS